MIVIWHNQIDAQLNFMAIGPQKPTENVCFGRSKSRFIMQMWWFNPEGSVHVGIRALGSFRAWTPSSFPSSLSLATFYSFPLIKTFHEYALWSPVCLLKYTMLRNLCIYSVHIPHCKRRCYDSKIQNVTRDGIPKVNYSKYNYAYF